MGTHASDRHERMHCNRTEARRTRTARAVDACHVQRHESVSVEPPDGSMRIEHAADAECLRAARPRVAHGVRSRTHELACDRIGVEDERHVVFDEHEVVLTSLAQERQIQRQERASRPVDGHAAAVPRTRVLRPGRSGGGDNGRPHVGELGFGAYLDATVRKRVDAECEAQRLA